jgi:hypothetical protein
MASFRVVCEHTQVPTREVDRRLRKVYNILSRPAPPRIEDSPAQAEPIAFSPRREDSDEGGDR